MDSVEYLTSCCIGQLIKDRIESEIDEALDTGTWVDIMVGKIYPEAIKYFAGKDYKVFRFPFFI